MRVTLPPATHWRTFCEQCHATCELGETPAWDSSTVALVEQAIDAGWAAPLVGGLPAGWRCPDCRADLAGT